ncbi:MAG TPA: FAD-binding oxidoreductase [Limnobacter sp.]|nr:FAD-binding oxidoreductase [Limnobacter sp.]
MPQVLLKNGTQFTALPGQSILTAALSNGVALEYSCNTGQCGVCAAQINAGATRALRGELGLSAVLAEAHYVLTCCREACSDLELNVEDLPELKEVPTKTTPAKIDDIEYIGPNTARVLLRTPPANTVRFLPGQYLAAIGPGGVRRAYSIANAPRSDGKIELHIRKVPGGAMSAYWFEQAKPNDLLRLEAPLGTFFLRTNTPKVLVLLATGTGLAPIKAMLEHLHALPSEQGPSEVHLYWGNRYESDIYLDAMQLAGHTVRVNTLLSQPGNGWQGRTGHVQQAVMQDKINLAQSAVYACGSMAMIESARALLTAHGLPLNQFYSDAFVSS